MPENPLLPDAELRALHGLLQAAAKAEAAVVRRDARVARRPQSSAHSPGREALLAGTLLQLRSGDLLVAASDDPSAGALLPAAAAATGEAAGMPEVPTGSPLLLVAAAMAAALKAAPAAPADRLVLAMTQSGSAAAAGWPEALAWAQQRHLPLIVACADPSGSQAFQLSPRGASGALHWAALRKAAQRLGLPVLSVDGEDAVAVYRVMQESVLRARAGGGPAVLWAMLPGAGERRRGERAPSAAPLQRLKRYLRTRRISLSPRR